MLSLTHPQIAAPHPTPLATFLGHDENTMNEYTNASVGVLLLKLADTYLPKVSDKTEQNAAEIEKYFDKTIIALKAKLTTLKNYFKTSNEELDAVLAYIDHLSQQQTNELDNVTVYKNGKTEVHVISLKQVLAFVFTALTDKQIFESPFPNTLREEKEKNENDRLLTLYNTLNKLRKGKVNRTNFCHTGVRNDIACSLNGVYPNVRIIEQIDTAISMALQDFVFARLEEEKPAEQFRLLFHKLRDNVSSDEISDFEIFVTDEKFQKNAQEYLEQFCLDNGLNPNNETLVKIIKNNLLGLSSLPAPSNLHPQAVYLEELVTFAYSDKTLPQAARTQLQTELHSLTCFEDIEKKGLLHRHKAAELWQTIRAYENIPIIGAEEQDFANTIQALLKFLPNYFQQPNHASDIENNVVKQSITIIEAHEKKKPNQDFIASFFEFWLKADSAQKTSLRNRLLVEKAKLLLSNTDLTNFFASHAADNIVNIEPYHINLILLQAMLIPVTDWTPIFHECLTRIIAFIQNDFKENASPSAPSLIAANLRRNSYPNHFLKWFVVLQKLYLKVKQNEGPHFKVASDAIQAWMLDETKKLNLQNWLTIIEVMGNDIEQVIQDEGQLILILQTLDQNAQSALISALGTQLQAIIKYFILLVNLLLQLNKNVWPALFNALGAQVQTIISDGRKLAQLLLKFSNAESRSTLINALGPLVKIIIKNGTELRLVLRQLDQNSRSILIRLLGTQLQSIINDSEDIACTLEFLDPNFYGIFINLLGDKFKIIIRDYADLFWLLKKLNRDIQLALINILGTHVQTIIQDGYQLARVLEELNQKSKLAVMNVLGTHVQTIIQNGNQLARVLKELDEFSKLILIDILGTHVQTIIQDHDQLTAVLKQLEKNPHAQLRCLVLLDKKELCDDLYLKIEAVDIYINFCEFAKGKEPLQAAISILENYAQPELLGVFKLEVRDISCLKAVREALKDTAITSIDVLLAKITEKVSLVEIKEKDFSLYGRLLYVCALGNVALHESPKTVQSLQLASPLSN